MGWRWAYSTVTNPMTEFLAGYVIRGVEASSTNSSNTAAPSSGVSRGCTTVPAGYPPASAPVAPWVQQYEATVLSGAVAGSAVEYLVWAASTGSLVATPGTNAALYIPAGHLTVNSGSGTVADGTATVAIADADALTVGEVTAVTYTRGGGFPVTFTLAGGDYVYAKGYLTLLDTPVVRAAVDVPPLAPVAVSAARGDAFTAPTYTVAAATYWWTRNDAHQRCFAWTGATWEPLRGGPAVAAGRVDSAGATVLVPNPGLAVGAYLPGDDSNGGDAYASLRVGAEPSAASYPVVHRVAGDFSGALVVAEADATSSYAFGSTVPPLAAVVGSESGRVVWNPAFVSVHVGSPVWYSPVKFADGASGRVGLLGTPDLYLAPIPTPLQSPLVCLGSREPLTAVSADTEAALALLTVGPGQVGYALSTGKLKFNAGDSARADPGTRTAPNPLFDPLWLGVEVYYLGVTGNRYPQPLRAPCPLVDAAGTPITAYDPAVEVYIPTARELPGLGVSGVRWVPDGTGNPANASAAPTPRPRTSGLVRRVQSELGDAFVYGAGRWVPSLRSVDWEADLPTDPYSMPADEAVVARELHSPTSGSRVVFPAAMAAALAGMPLHYQQAELVPSTYPATTRVVARVAEPYVLAGTETLEFAADGVTVTWSAAGLGAGSHGAAAVAASLTAAVAGAGAPATAGTLAGRVVLAPTDPSGTLAVGYGGKGGPAALGILPGWRVSNVAGAAHGADDPNWLPDTGWCLGVARSPSNLDGTSTAPALRSRVRRTDHVLTSNVLGVPYQLLDYPPLEDQPGYAPGVFFNLSTGGAGAGALTPWQNVEYEFGARRFAWLSRLTAAGSLTAPTNLLNLGVAAVRPASLLAGLGGGLQYAPAGQPYAYLEPGTDYLLPEGSGTALLVQRVGTVELTRGYAGSSTGTATLVDLGADFVAANVQPGDRFELVKPEGYYLVASVDSAKQVTFTEAVPAATEIQWAAYSEGPHVPAAPNPAVVADVAYREFSALPTEPFQVRLLESLGTDVHLYGDLNPALAAGWTLGARFGLHGATVPLTVLEPAPLGTLTGPTGLTVPAGPNLVHAAFNLQLGTRVYAQGVDLVGVGAFSPDPGSTVEYLTATGELKFGSAVLAAWSGVNCVYVPTLLPAAVIADGTGYADPATREVRLSAADRAAHPGVGVYLVEEVGRGGVALNPLVGSLTLSAPVRALQLVEATYYRAVPDTGARLLVDGAPVLRREFLSVKRTATATRLNGRTYGFNPGGYTLDPQQPPTVRVGARSTSYGVPPQSQIGPDGQTIAFTVDVAASATVTVTYYTYEAAGGETSYAVAKPPVWRPPFNLRARQVTVPFAGNRTGLLQPGRLLRVGTYCTYVRAVTYDAGLDVTTVTVWPPPAGPVGSLAPSDNSLNLVTDRAICAVVDPAGPAPTPVANVDGRFFPPLTVVLGLSAVPYFDPVAPGATSLRFEGDLTAAVYAGIVVEMFGVPALVTSSALSTDGQYTLIQLGAPYSQAFAWSDALDPAYVRVTARPIYPETANVFVGPGQLVASEPYTVALYQPGRPGRALVEGSEYRYAEGTLTLTGPAGPAGLGVGGSVRMYRTQMRTVAPRVLAGVAAYPRVAVSAAYLDPPSSANGRLGGELRGTYTYAQPDAFYQQLTPLSDYAVTVTAELLGANAGEFYGSRGLRSPAAQRADLVARDRVARAYLGWYNGTVTALEQVLETLSGEPVGDRDGKFRSWTGEGNPWTPPGYADPIDGTVNPRDLWRSVFTATRGALPWLYPVDGDPIVDPVTAVADANGVVSGDYDDPATFASLQAAQRAYVLNDLDDRALVARSVAQRELSGLLWFTVKAYGRWAELAQPGELSRLYPLRTRAFMTAGPGLGAAGTAPGFYSAGRYATNPVTGASEYASTTGRPIAQLGNPALGNLTGVTSALVSDRRARAHVLGYRAEGYAAVNPATAHRPTFWAGVVPPTQFPLLNSGLPDAAALASQSTPAGTPDLNTGDPAMHLPPLVAGDQLALGLADGTVLPLGYTGTVYPVGSTPAYAGVFVEAVLSGCLVTVRSVDGAGSPVPIADAAALVTLSGPAAGSPLEVPAGATLVTVAATGGPVTVADPPTASQLQLLNAATGTYRMGVDVTLNAATGQLLDATLPSFTDPTLFGLREITGQRPPQPLSTLQAEVTLASAAAAPAALPALAGRARLDSGDYSLPYYSVASELQVLGAGAPLSSVLLTGDSATPPPAAPATVAAYAVGALYPEELLANGAAVDPAAADYPAAYVTGINLDPAASVYPLPGHAGVGGLRPYDLLLVQGGVGGVGYPLGATGILQVGAVDAAAGTVEPPRFATATNRGSGFTVEADRWQVQTSYPGYAYGIVVTEDTTVPGVTTTTFDISSCPYGEVAWDDGAGSGVLPLPTGGFNALMVGSRPGSQFLLELIDKTSGGPAPGNKVVVQSLMVGPDVLTTTFTATDGGVVEPCLAGGVYWLGQQLVVTTANPWFDFAPFNPTVPGPGLVSTGGYHEFWVGYAANGSSEFTVEGDRLTVTGPVDPRSARAYDAVNWAGTSLAVTVTTGDQDYRLVDSTTGLDYTTPCSLNSTAAVNGGVPFLFRARAGVASPYGVGKFTGGRGSVKVSAVEGAGNVPVAGTAITLAGMAAARQDATGPLLAARGLVGAVSNLTYNAPHDNRITFPDPAGATPYLTGDLAHVLPGDLVCIAAAYDDPSVGYPYGSGKAGTWVVRGAVPYNDPLVPRERRATLVSAAGDSSGWLKGAFPLVTGVTVGATVDLTVDAIVTVPTVVNVAGTPVSPGAVFPPLGRVYVLVDESLLGATTAGAYAPAVYSAAYASIAGNTFADLTDYRDAVGAAVAAPAFVAALAAGQRVSGMVTVPVEPSGGGVPARLPGYTDLDSPTKGIFGFRAVTVARGLVARVYVADVAGVLAGSGGATGALTPYQWTPAAAYSYAPADAVLHWEVAAALALNLSAADWDALHTTGAFTPAGTRCLLPGDVLTAEYSGAVGLYLEPSTPRPTNDLAAARMNLVDYGHSLTAAEVGTRPLNDYVTVVPAPGQAFLEYAQLEVRRARRWQEVGTSVADAYGALRPLLEVRRGLVAACTDLDYGTLLTAEPVDTAPQPQPQVGGGPTQLGPWEVAGVRAGAWVRFLTADGAVQVEATVEAVTGPLQLRLSPRGLGVVPGQRFEVYLREPPVPQEQSAQQLYEYAFERTLVQRVADYSTGSGGYVPWVADADPQVAYDQSVNRLHDSDPAVNYVTAQVAVGDLVWVEPAGPLAGPTGPAAPPEYGAGPAGDAGVATRPAVYAAGSPVPLDDNRGYYWVAAVAGDHLRVEAAGNLLAGDRTSGDKVLGTGTHAYVIYPTVHGSRLSGAGTGREGQMDLRPTAYAGPGNSYAASYRSVAPFGYRVLRPNPLLSPAAVELICANRERVASWMELLRGFLLEDKGGSYWTFQRWEQIASLGSVANPAAGTGVASNAYLTGAAGRTDVSPFANGGTCLSALDRRFWGLDYRLDSLTPPLTPGAPPYADYEHGAGRPVLVDRIEQVLGAQDRLRATRGAWLNVRADCVTGTLASVRRSDAAAAATSATAQRLLLVAAATRTRR